MRHPAGRVIGSSLLSCQRLAPPRLFGALLASVVLHGVLLSQLRPENRPHHAPEPVPLVLMAHLWIPAPSLKPPPPVVPIAATERTTAAKQSARRTAILPQVSVVDAPSAAATLADPHKSEPLEPAPSAPSSALADRPLDLSPQMITQAVRRNSSSSLAQASRAQLGNEPAPAAARLGQHIASGAVPDCLHNAPDGEAKSRPVAIGGLLALPFLAYSAMTGKCK